MNLQFSCFKFITYKLVDHSKELQISPNSSNVHITYLVVISVLLYRVR
jgi:hypothetical protein